MQTWATQRLRDIGQLARNGLVEVSQFTGTGDADIEDLFEPAFYLELVDRAYTKDLLKPIKTRDLNTRDPRIIRQVETYSQAHGSAAVCRCPVASLTS